LYDHAQRANWIGGVGHNQLRHKPELDGRYSAHKLHDQQLHGIEEWNLDWNRNRNNVCRHRALRLDSLQLHGGGNGR
jgi:hypothetical protein